MQDNNIFTLVVTDADKNNQNYVNLYELPLDLLCQGETAIINKFKEIAQDYLKTPEGQVEYKHNLNTYTWLDFLNMPSSFLENYGIHELRICSEYVQTVDGNEKLN